MVDMQDITDLLMEKAALYVPKIILALLTLGIGLWVIRIVVKMMMKQLKKRKVDPSLEHFLESLVGILLKIMLFITVISMFGVQMTSFIAILGAAGLAVGLALQGSLANLAAGVLILLFKPFKVGDLIEAQGFLGTINKIQIFSTLIKTPDNKMVVMPNGVLTSGAITNYTAEKVRRVDLTFGIGYGDDIKKAQDLLLEMVGKHKKVLKDPAPMVRVSELADSSVNFTVRPWCKTEDYWDVFFDLTEQVKLRFDKEGISIPFPQRDVHMHNA